MTGRGFVRKRVIGERERGESVQSPSQSEYTKADRHKHTETKILALPETSELFSQDLDFSRGDFPFQTCSYQVPTAHGQ